MTTHSHAKAEHALQNEPDLDLTVDESQQRIARVMQLPTASVNGSVQVKRGEPVLSCEFFQELSRS